MDSTDIRVIYSPDSSKLKLSSTSGGQY